MFCFSCGAEIKLEKQPARGDTCPKCSSYLHCCRNCRFYDVNAYHQCREPQAEFVPDKAMGNFCEYFEASARGTEGSAATRAAEARKKLEEIFKKK
ncbi:MAG: hypothetical protein ONB44_09635 [candidate division KSB1 bacterium]|nr:hypothetical protein [candidate division KSB1 bacterium]MDZ7302389.1 hypothetical protein [candidate division KSB1 bacterium]MDZ7311592.1 hypothetical protein [candidate division KSB1 bacterium]